MIGYIISEINLRFFKKETFVFLLGTQKNRLYETILLRIQTCKKLLSVHVSFCLSRVDYQVRLKRLFTLTLIAGYRFTGGQ